MDRTPILIAEDDVLTRDVLVAAVRMWGYEPIEAENGGTALELLQAENAPRLAILDWSMPDVEGTEICRKVRCGATGSYVYLLLLTSRSDHACLVEGLEAGADDFVTKPFDPDELRLRLRTGARVIELQDRLSLARNALSKSLERDLLTGLATREAIVNTLAQELDRSKRLRTSLSVLVIEVDDFHLVNTEYGEDGGDRLLSHIAGLLQGQTRMYDTCGRLGCYEFMLLLPGTSPAEAETISERICAIVRRNPLRCGDEIINSTVSVASVSCDASSGQTADDVVGIASDRLTDAKTQGGNAATRFPESAITR